MNKFIKDLNFYQVDLARNKRWYQKEYHLVGIFSSQIHHAFLNFTQRFPHEGKFWLTVKKELTGKEIKYTISLDAGQGREEITRPVTEYECKSLLLDWENKLKTYNIHQ